MTINKQLGARIRYLRQQKGLSIEDLSLEAEINRNYLGFINKDGKDLVIWENLCTFVNEIDKQEG